MTAPDPPIPVPCSAQPGWLSEGPRWDGDRDELLWVDIFGSRLLELDGTSTTVLTGLTISNGIGWSPDGGTMYLSDSGTGCIDAFDFDAAGGNLSRRRTIVRITEPDVAPDGLTVDDAGALWVAMWGGGALRRYSPEGSMVVTVPVPVDRPTSCAFGAPDRATLFITTARDGLHASELARQPDAGRVFRVHGLGVTGPPCATYRGQMTPS